MSSPPILIAGGGIGGLVTALTLHQLGLPCIVFEKVRNPKPLGVGINLQPNAVRELYDLGIGADHLDKVGLPAREWALVGLNGKDIHAEPRGTDAGYHWPQYAVSRGGFHMLLLDIFRARAGDAAIRTGQEVTGYRNNADGTVTALLRTAEGRAEQTGALLIGAEGIHSPIRAQMHPDQPPIHWGGAIMWRGMTRAKPIRTGSSFVGLGTATHRVILYPISRPGPDGLAQINWIAERSVDPAQGWQGSGWFEPVEPASLAHHFNDFRYDWLDVPDLILRSETAFSNAMIDRDPIPFWVDGGVALLGDAAHAMYPTGSNGASQAIIDARTLGAAMLEHGATPQAFNAYNDTLCAPVGELVLRNRGLGPFGLLKLVDDRCGGRFDHIDDVLPAAERAAFLADYKSAAGFAMEALNVAPRTIPEGMKVTS